MSLELIRFSLELSRDITLRLADGLMPHALVTNTPGGRAGDGNHAIWTVGHLAATEMGIRALLDGHAPEEAWMKKFGQGTTCVTDADAYPSLAAVIDRFKGEREKTMTLLGSLTEADLRRAISPPPPGFENELSTFGKSLMTLSLHNTIHVGQLTDARRQAGVPRLS